MKKSKKISLFLAFAVLAGGILPPPAVFAFGAGIPITATSAVLLDDSTGKIIYAKTPHERRAPASTTKILTAIVALDRLDLNAVVRVPSYAPKIEPSKIYLHTGEKYRARELIRALLISSANDAAEALANAAGGGSRSRFIEMMNGKARAIGCQGSHFATPSGLPAPHQYSTAYDLALIMREAQRYPFLVQTMKIRTIVIKSVAGRKIFLKNHNKMLWRDRREILGKTGWTRTAQHCFVGAINLGYDRTVFVSMLGSHRLWRDLKTLVDYQFGCIAKPARPGPGPAHHNARSLQLTLKKAGFYQGRVDGKIGRRTRKALKNFQARHGLRPDGIAGPQTWQKLSRYL